jgi:hypothetical protein
MLSKKEMQMINLLLIEKIQEMDNFDNDMVDFEEVRDIYVGIVYKLDKKIQGGGK